MKNILPLGLDEVAAIIVLLISFIPHDMSLSILDTLQSLAVFYLFMCIAFRKYEAIQAKHK